MADAPTSKDLRAKRPTVRNADVPSESALLGLPDVGQGASGAHFARDTVGHQANEGDDGEGNHAPADGRDPKV